ncbi:MAG: response regulator [Pseudomonadota bacterium]
MATANSGVADAIVNIVDDDEAVRDAIRLLLGSIGLRVRCFPDAQSFLDQYDSSELGCIVLDIRMPGMSGLRLQELLNERGCSQPIIFITGHGDIPMAVQAMRSGAADFIQKPFRDQDLIDCIHEALNSARAVRASLEDTRLLRQRFDSLTDRERDVFERVAKGLANKQIAHELGVSQRTVEIHRAHVMEKLGARNLAQLVRCHVRLAEPA